MTTADRNAPTRRLPLALGTGAFLLVLLTLDGPGITIDEPLDVRVGHLYVRTLGLWAQGRWSPFRRADVDLVFAGSAQHPPLGRVLVGAASLAAGPLFPLFGRNDTFGVEPARLAPAVAFGVLAAWLATFAQRRSGRAAAVATVAALVMTPRLFAHAHLATLETILNLFWVGTLLAAARAPDTRRPILGFALAGGVWGLALLTKIHAWLLPPLVIPWAIARLGWRRGTLAGLAWMAAGLVVLLAGWPWLWFETGTRLRGFLSTSVDRAALRVLYLGTVYEDRNVPWHYPWLYFAGTVPVGLLVLGILGAITGWRGRLRDASPLLFGAGILLLLAVFSTRAPVYDGERLFLPVFPLWALLIGRGMAALVSQVGGASRGRRWICGALGVALAAQSWGVIRLHPFQLSYYNALVGGLPGAARHGLELTYWGDAVNNDLLAGLAARVQPGQVVALVPTLHHVQAVATTTAALARRGILLQDQAAADHADWLVVFRRTAYWPQGLEARLNQGRAVASNARQGVWLATLWDLSPNPPAPPPKPAARIDAAAELRTIRSE